MSNKKGFTLMEILFVLLVIALIVSFALPALRSVRYDIRNSRAKAAVKKLAEARRSYYQYMRGGRVQNGAAFNAETTSMQNATCTNLRASGKPGSSSDAVAISELFGCGFLNWKDFVGLPYTFYICDLDEDSGSAPCLATGIYAGAVGNSSAGSKYNNPSKYYIYVDETMKVKEHEED